MKVLVTGSKGFVGKNLVLKLKESGREVIEYDKDTNVSVLVDAIKANDLWFIYHLAGVNRPENIEEFKENTTLTEDIIGLMEKYNCKAPILMNSSIQADLANDYGKSKKAAEDALKEYSEKTGNLSIVFRCPNVFGKWCRPNYNSVIATFCYNVANGIPLQVNEAAPEVPFIYIDDLIDAMMLYTHKRELKGFNLVKDFDPVYHYKPKHIAKILYDFAEIKYQNDIPVQDGFEKKLYATYLSYLPKESMKKDLNMHIDGRGSFTELYHTQKFGQTSVNIIHPGITKGNHYHNTKNEKFIVVKGVCEIKMRNVLSDEVISFICSGENIASVDMIPGYTHNITNIGKEDAVVVMWANESFDETNPDTYFLEV